MSADQAATGRQDGHLQAKKVICVRKSPTGPEIHTLFSLEEDSDNKNTPYRLVTQEVRELSGIPVELLVADIPDYLRDTSSRKVHVVVSTGSGTGLALKFYESVLEPLLRGLGLSNDGSQGAGDSSAYALTITQDAQSIKRFARDLNMSSKGLGVPSIEHTVVLLSGDGGTVELLNGKAPGDEEGTTSTPPLIAALPLGTGNALFHSLHKSLYAAADEPGPSPLVLGLRTLLRGQPKPLPSFKAEFSAGSRTIAYTKPDSGESHTEGIEGSIKEQSDAISYLYGAIVASYGLHSQLVWESDTPEYRKHGSRRFQMVAAELMKENHAYNAKVDLISNEGAVNSSISREKHAYILATLVSNLEKTFTISPASKPLDGTLRLVHFGPIPAEKFMEIMMQAYNNGSHIGMEWEADDGRSDKVGYDAVEQVKVTICEEDPRWRKVCIDGTIVEIPKGGSLTVATETITHLQVLVSSSIDHI